MLALFLLYTVLTAAAPAPASHHLAELSAAGFKDAYIHSSLSGKAICVSGKIPVTASAQNIKIDFEVPRNQSGAAKTLLDFFTPGSSYVKDTISGKRNVQGIWDIAAELCFPYTAGSVGDVKGLHTTTHGGGFDRRYWDFPPGFSYVDSAVAAGWAVLNYDRMSWGQSDTPDPLNIVQFPLIVSQLHQLNVLLRSGGLANTKFDTIVGVGHSFGSITSGMVNTFYPTDWNATILTGYSLNLGGGGQVPFLASLGARVANQFDPYRFPPSTVSDGYVTIGSQSGIEYAFLYPYNYPPDAVSKSFASSYGLTWGELISLSAVGQPNATQYSASLAVVNGMQDLSNCSSNCSYRFDQAAAVRGGRYPAVRPGKFDSILIDGVGHGLNVHYQATGAFE